ncbi:MAG: hypothetical protein IT385_01015 [Deltaproteobacteria bacterium]|nr:hypothetical protein [Deltaproteobacteria bacterium]
MLRWIGLAMVTMALTFSACGSRETKKDGGTEWVPVPDAQAFVGTWGAGANTLSFQDNGQFRMEKETPCGKPPCPTSASSGSYRITQGKLYLEPSGGELSIMDFSFANNQNTVTLTDPRGATTYSRK